MRTLDPGLAAHLASGATTLCHCWKVTRTGASPMGFTDHDEAVSFDGTVYAAATGFEASAIEAGLGLSVANQDVMGALASAGLTEADLAAGFYDGAGIEIWRVNWANPAQRVMLLAGEIGAVTRTPLAFTAEVRSLAHRLNRPVGRVYQYACDADLGDARCKVNVNQPAFRATGAVTGVAGARQFAGSGLSGFAPGWFVNGTIAWTSGANAGLTRPVKASAGADLELWEPMPFPVAVADAFAVTAGCSKTFAVCKAKFNNGLNFRGAPLMPGNDWVVSAPAAGGHNDGGKLTG
jgi:uncharacterized phage protein (TIGR02218 family)